MKDYRRIDRFIESSIYAFAEWIAESTWQGKERDCVNIFSTRFILPAINCSTAITDYSQVRIECGVPQPKGELFNRPAAAKDLVIWRDPLEVAWDSEWQAKNIPWVVIEWKTRRKGEFDSMFDPHDVSWLEAFTAQNPNAFGYTVTVDFRGALREVHFARFKNGTMKVNQRLIERANANKTLQPAAGNVPL
jgi:hypothetical protein